MKPDATYISKFLNDMRQDLEGLHRRIEETERVRYGEDPIQLPSDEAKTGIELRIFATAELIENVKLVIGGNFPQTVIHAVEETPEATANASKRERFHNRLLHRINRENPVLSQFLDNLVGNGTACIKAAKVDYPPGLRDRLDGESASDHVKRVKKLKALNGPPIEVVDLHPLSFYWRLGMGDKVVEVLEHSWKPKLDTYRNYGITDQQAASARNFELTGSHRMLNPRVVDYVRGSSGTPDNYIQSWPYGFSTSTRTLVSEYWSPDCAQVYLDRRLVREEENPAVQYFICFAKTNGSKDLDKKGFGVAEIIRKNEPTINRMITRMAEANEMLVRQRLTIELPEGSPDDTEFDSKQGRSVPKVYRFRPDGAESLPAGAKVVHPYSGIGEVYQSMPLVELLLRQLEEKGASPLFKGKPSAADSSGYRDNSLYMMARSQLQDIIDNYQETLTAFIHWVERQICDDDEPWYLDELELSKSDIEKWPAEVSVTINPSLPQNMIAEGAFWDRMWASRHVSRRIVRERGFHEEDPDAVEEEVLLEDIQEALKPALYADVIAAVIATQPDPMSQQSAGMPEDQNPMDAGANPNSQRTQIQQGRRASMGRPAGRELGGYSTQGNGRQPALEPGALL